MTYWTYLFAYDRTVGSYEKVREFIDNEPSIVNWKYYLPNTFLIVSPRTASGLTDIFLEKLTKKKGRFIIVDTATDKSGWLPKAAWDLMKEPKTVWDK